ncbi:MAG TPA: nicotinate phosphoribosyltransferase [Vicinamibacterales bacterium]
MTAFSTDLYQLTMMAGYVAAGRHEDLATFELFVRRLPRQRAFLVTAGLEQALEYIETLRFTDDEIEWLRAHPAFAAVPMAFFEYLARFEFAGDVHAMPEGTPFFPNEPIVRVTAPLAQAQLLETALLAIVNFQTSIASKGVRCVAAANGKPVMEFGARRAHGTEAALYAARAAHLAGCSATSFVEAGRRFGIPLSGTMAHSWVLAARSEREAFEEYSTLFGSHTALLLDTYDVRAAAEMVVASGMRPPAVRIDSGDLAALAREVRGIFDRGGLRDTRILVSGDLDEFKIREMEAAGAPIDGYAVGTALTTSDDAPALGGVYKLVELASGGQTRRVMKRSTGKATWPGRKQVWRLTGHDVVALEGEDGPAGATPLLELVISKGARVAPTPSMERMRERCRTMVAALPEDLRELDATASRPVNRSRTLDDLLR